MTFGYTQDTESDVMTKTGCSASLGAVVLGSDSTDQNFVDLMCLNDV